MKRFDRKRLINRETPHHDMARWRRGRHSAPAPSVEHESSIIAPPMAIAALVALSTGGAADGAGLLRPFGSAVSVLGTVTLFCPRRLGRSSKPSHYLSIADLYGETVLYGITALLLCKPLYFTKLFSHTKMFFHTKLVAMEILPAGAELLGDPFMTVFGCGQ
jgi:hypothetical protein